MSNVKIAVIGAGTMGNGIAHSFAMHGFKTYLCDLNNEILKKSISIININLDRQIKKDIISEADKNKILSRIHVATNLNSIPQEVNLVIEAISEDKNAKLILFRMLEGLMNEECIFASNTSAISITEMATACRPDRFIGMHFMNPVPVMNLVEIIRGYSTSDKTYNIIKDICVKLGKEPVCVNDYPGFVSNRVLMPLINEAIYAVYEGIASAIDIDKVFILGMNHPMGPLTLADFIGLDVCLNIMDVMYEGFNNPKYAPCPLLRKMVSAGFLGKKTGKGFYNY